VLRAFTGGAPLDAYVDALAIPEHPRWLAVAIRLLRWYRRRVSPSLGQRCVFEPSCSRYAELVLRRRRLVPALTLIARRLFRCRPGGGGVDFPE
jgi:putative membrane protein insertion efficiency factor